MIDFTKVGRVGDNVRNIGGDVGTIDCLSHGEKYPVLMRCSEEIGCTIAYTATGMLYTSDDTPSLMFANGSVTIDQGTPSEYTPKESEAYWRRFYPVTVGRVTTIDKNSQPEKLYCGLTKKQWQRVIDGRFMLGFSDESVEHARVRSDTDKLKEVREHGGEYPFISKSVEAWMYAAIPNTKGIRKPHFGGDCPTTHKGAICYKLRDGAWVNILIAKGVDVWPWCKSEESGTDIIEYIELP